MDAFHYPFTVIDNTYKLAFTGYLDIWVAAAETTIAGPFLACVTLWVIVQGILVMRGDVDARRSLTKLISVALVVGLVTTSSLYQEYVQDLFETAIPAMVTQLAGNPPEALPLELDLIFREGEVGFQEVAAEIPPMDEVDGMAFEGAQVAFFFSLWGIFGVYDLVDILMKVLVSLGPLFLIGFLFEATKDITMRWVGQLVSYGILLLLTTMVATVVVATMATYMAALFLVTIKKGTTAGQIMGLYELDLFIMTGNALVVALPGIAAALGNGVAVQGAQMAQSVYRNFAERLPKGGGPPIRVSGSTTMRNSSTPQ